MPKTKVDDWSATAGSNTDVGGISIQGTAPRSNFDNALREIMAQVAATPLAEAAADMRTNLSVYSQAESAATYFNQTTGGAIGGTAVRGDKVEILDESSASLSVKEASATGDAIIRLYRSRGTIAAPTAIQTNDAIGGISMFGYDGSAWSTKLAEIRAYATQNFTGSAHGAKLLFQVTPNDTTAAISAGEVSQDGTLKWDYGIASRAVGAGDIYYRWESNADATLAEAYVVAATGDLHLKNSTANKTLTLKADGTLYYAGVQIANADGSLVGVTEAPTAGDTWCAYAVSDVQYVAGFTSYVDVARFTATIAGTVRVRGSLKASASGGTQYIKVLKNGSLVAEWSRTASTYAESTTDVAVSVGDVLQFQAKYVSYVGQVKDIGISAAAYTPCVIGGA